MFGQDKDIDEVSRGVNEDLERQRCLKGNNLDNLPVNTGDSINCTNLSVSCSTSEVISISPLKRQLRI